MSADLLRGLIYATLASSAAILMILALRKPLRMRLGARAAYATWAIVPLAAAVFVLPVPTAPVSLQLLSIASDQSMPAAARAFAQAQSTLELTPWLLGIWLAGVTAVLALQVCQQRRFVRSLGELSTVDSGIVRAQTSVGCPALIGAWRQRVVVPADFEQRYTGIERELILAHERNHRARGDAQVNLLAAAMRCVFWFNPLVHFAASRFRFDQELACDAAVIACFPQARRSYADAMLKTQLADFGLPVGCHWQSSHPLKERIMMLKHPLPGRARAAMGSAIALTLALTGSYVAWASQPAAPAQAKSQTMPSQTAIAPPDSDGPTDMAISYRKLHPPVYPAQQVSNGVEGILIVRVQVDVAGTVVDARIDLADPPTMSVLAESTLAAVKSWTFNPPQSGGKAVATTTTLPIRFHIQGHVPQKIPALPAGALDTIDVTGVPEKPVAALTDAPATFDVAKAPKYPAAAKKAHQTGSLVLKLHVDENGKPRSAVINKAEPAEAESIFGASSIATAMTWKFHPAIKDGKRVADDLLVPIDFSLSANE